MNTTLFFDSAMGTMLQKHFPSRVCAPVERNLICPDEVLYVHEQNLLAGARILTTNSFGTFSFKYKNYRQLIESSIEIAKKAISTHGLDKTNAKIAFDIGPTGKLMEPLGNCSFNELYNIFSQTAIAAEECGADFILFETFSDIAELRTAILAAKENTKLPIICSLTYGSSGKTYTGCSALCALALINSLSLDYIGVNCGVGFDTINSIVDCYLNYSDLKIIVQPNAGLPTVLKNSENIYNMNAHEFANGMHVLYKKGVGLLGGCCGTEPSHIEEMIKICNNIEIERTICTRKNILSSYNKTLILEDEILEIGHSLDITSNKELLNQLINGDFELIAETTLDDVAEDANVLLVKINSDYYNKSNEELSELLCHMINNVQRICSLPMIFCENNPVVLESVLRRYIGRAGYILPDGTKCEKQNEIHSIATKYGAILIDTI